MHIHIITKEVLMVFLPQGRTIVVGILNVTPDSFSDGSVAVLEVETAVTRARQMVDAGADIIDIGGESTRPGFEPVDTETEKRRVLPVIQCLHAELPGVSLSIDTRKPEVAEEALRHGAQMVNAYGGLDHPEMRRIVGKYRCPVIAYHTDPLHHVSDRYALRAVKRFFRRQEDVMTKLGMSTNDLILDPGIGWKTLSQTLYLLDHLEELQGKRSRTLLIAVSRKQHLGFLLQRELKLGEVPGPLERVEAGLAETAIAILRGVRLVRTHDVAATKKFLALFDLLHSRR